MLTIVIGGADLVVVSTDDAVLVCPRERTQEIKAVVERLQAEGAREATLHRREIQAWGYSESAGERVKRIVIDPQGVVASGRQRRQSVHWIVLKGTANTIVEDVERTVREGGSLHVPRAAMYQLANLGKIPLEIIEVQIDAKSSEDDMPQLQGTGDRKSSKSMRAVAAAPG
jgi:mannose-6-phosphate isomerase-like protein (cupin superfamily)